jgi:hypothetical protein
MKDSMSASERAGHPGTYRKADKTPTNPFPVVYLRCVDAGTDCECWVVCSKGDPGATQFERS